nr:wiskott-Aldrich syndrome protein homolog [Macaca nemestrina]
MERRSREPVDARGGARGGGGPGRACAAGALRRLAPGLPSRPACSSARLPGDRRSRLPPSPLPAGPRPGGARSHPRPKPPSSRALRTGARKLPPAGTLRRVPEPGRAGPPADRPLYWVTGLAHRPAGRSHLGGRAARGSLPIPRPAPDTLRMTKELEIHININWSRLTQTMRILLC